MGRELQRNLKMTKGKTAVYSPADEAMAYLGAQMAGMLRLNHIDQLLPEGKLAEILGIPQWPSENTEQRFLKRATEATLRGLDEVIRDLVLDDLLDYLLEHSDPKQAIRELRQVLTAA